MATVLYSYQGVPLLVRVPYLAFTKIVLVPVLKLVLLASATKTSRYPSIHMSEPGSEPEPEPDERTRDQGNQTSAPSSAHQPPATQVVPRMPLNVSWSGAVKPRFLARSKKMRNEKGAVEREDHTWSVSSLTSDL
eukprot:scaffold4522_cov47-Prasinocladus_malaysianus.AAC.2